VAKKDILGQVKEYFDAHFGNEPFELCDVQFVKEGSNWYLRIFADKEGGIFIDDLEKISRTIEAEIDKDDIIEPAYILEVSSPGIDRPLKSEADYERFAGRIVDVKLYKALDGVKEFQGKLLGRADGNLSIEAEDGRILEFLLSDVAICRLAVIF